MNRVAVVVAAWGDPWDERQVAARRIAGALANEAQVQLCRVEEGTTSRTFATDGPFEVNNFPGSSSSIRRREWLLGSLADATGAAGEICACAEREMVRTAKGLPQPIQQELNLAFGGHSPALLEHLTHESYDYVVFMDHRPASTVEGIARVAPSSRIALVPFAVGDPLEWCPLYDPVFDRPDRLISLTRGESSILSSRSPSSKAKVREVGFVQRVAGLASRTDPIGFEERPYLVVNKDWGTDNAFATVYSLAARLQWDFPDVEVVAIGPGAESLPEQDVVKTHKVDNQMDAWRWVGRALAYWDPEPHLALGKAAIEAMLYGVPLLAHARGGATAEYVLDGDGGLLYSSPAEFREAIRVLLDDPKRSALGRQAQRYALERFSDPEAFTSRVAEAILGD